MNGELESCLATFRRHLHFPDPGSLLVALATVAANRAEGDPVWLLLVGPPGGGKTEVLGALSALEDVHPAATLTEASLLSGTPRKEHAEDSRGGLLRSIGSFGLVLCKDFGSVLSMNRDARAALLAALREIYDGSWTRHVGTEGGRTLHWEGKIGLVAGCTPSIDSHGAVMGSMGERFVLFRLPPVDGDAQASRALSHLGSERAMRVEMATAVRAVLDSVKAPDLVSPPGPELERWLISTATLAVRCRSSVERDSYSREIQLIPESEAPARLALVLLRLHNGLRAIGVDESESRVLVAKAALDSMPAIRRAVLDVVTTADSAVNTTRIAEEIRYPSTTTRRACEDLAAHNVIRRIPSGQGKADEWAPTVWTMERWLTVTVPEKSDNVGVRTVPEKSDELLTHPHRIMNDKSGTVPDRAMLPVRAESLSWPDDSPPWSDEDFERLFGNEDVMS